MGLDIGKLHVRRSSLIAATPARVWEEFDTTERFTAWFGRGHTLHTYEPKIGGSVEMSVEIDGERQKYGGEILIFEPEREVSFSINWHHPDRTWPVPTLWTVRLTSLYDGTHVEIFHHGFERLGANAGDQLQGYESGWNMIHLTALADIING